MMVKGKTISSSSSSTTQQITVGLRPSKKITVSTTPSIPNENAPKIISSNRNAYMEESDVLYLHEQYIRDNVRGYDPMFYKEMGVFLESIEIRLTKDNIEQNLVHFAKFGDNIQTRIQNIGNVLDFITKESFGKIIDRYKTSKTFWGLFSDLSKDFDKFNDDVNELYLDLSEKIKHFDNNKDSYFKNFEKLDFYYDSIKVIATDLSKLNIMENEKIQTSIIGSKINSLFMSKQVVTQFKDVYKFELDNMHRELSTVKNYLTTLKPSLELLKHNDHKKFKQQFENIFR